MIQEDASALETTLSRTVFYGFKPDELDASLDEVLVLFEFPVSRPEHVYGEPTPALTYYGITVHARASTQDEARSLCESAYTALLGMGYLALSPVMTLGMDDKGRFEAAAQVEAHAVS